VSIERDVENCTSGPPEVEWSVSVYRDGIPVAGVEPERVLGTASVGKAFLLLCVARMITDGSIDPSERLQPERGDEVGDSGIWQHLEERSLSISSLCALVGAASDNLATNVLLRRVGMDAAARVSADLQMPDTLLCDRIRDLRGPTDPPRPSQGRSIDLANLMFLIATNNAYGQADELVRSWLTLNMDLSMVAAAFGLDPLAHSEDGPLMFNKTGTDDGVRADTGCLRLESGLWTYAAIANWDRGESRLTQNVLDRMRQIGEAIGAA